MSKSQKPDKGSRRQMNAVEVINIFSLILLRLMLAG